MDGALFATTEAHACEKSSVSREFVPCTSRFPTLQDFPVGDRLISRVGDHLEGVTGGAVGDDS